MKNFIFNQTELVQKHSGKPSCEGCFFEKQNIKLLPCCEMIGEGYVFPCHGDVIYVKKEDNSKT